MFHRTILRHIMLAAGLVLAFGSFHASAQQDDTHRGRHYKVPPLSSRIEVTVVRAASGKPVEAAAVIFHPMEGESDKGSMELKTNEDGKVVIDVIPVGDTVRLQVIAHGFQTYGEDIKIDKESMTKEIRLKRPGEQYSIYKNNNQSPDSGKGSSDQKPSPDKPSDDKPKDAPAPDSQPAPNPPRP